MTHQWLITYQWRNNYVMTHALLGDPSNSFQVPTVFSNPFLTHLGTTNAYTKITKSCRRKNHDVTIINTYLVVIYCNNLKYNHKKTIKFNQFHKNVIFEIRIWDFCLLDVKHSFRYHSRRVLDVFCTFSNRKWNFVTCPKTGLSYNWSTPD